MVVGVIDHATGTRDIRRLAWLGRRSRPLLIIAIGATASMAALPPFLGFVAKEADLETVLHSPSLGAAAPLRARRHRARLGVHHHLQPALPVRRVRPTGRAEPEHAGGRNAPPRNHFPVRAGDAGRRRPGVRGVAGQARQRARRATPTPCPAEPDYHLRAVARARRCRCCCRSLVLAAGAAAFFGRARLPRPAAPCASRWATPTASTTPRSAGSTSCGRAAHRVDPARLDSGHAVGDPVAPWCWCPSSSLALGARDRPEFALWDSPLQVVVGADRCWPPRSARP